MMLHKLFDKEPWFAPRRYGYGSGLPITWQGWVLLLSYVALVIGIARLGAHASRGTHIATLAAIFLATCLFSVIVARHTRGGWKWRWGKKD
ncbi:hypothetical protein WSK_0689 [Novosphingobium sp. Rr 2-17]|uniref:hypothetical protein n=1 Tax=Novosphingobium sp. Rr 2-17 TaxID=555793 RepID=UPI0002697B04|nr:hypothetical protein [Novosphingobium sp. Rr 2-17]EIZ80716.1 hypothetical protein WSK_0689 [Novosphingobium sp. Rr 2-17]